MKTAIQNLYNDILEDALTKDIPLSFIQSITSKFAKSMDEEKQQIIEAYASGTNHEYGWMYPERYYNETFNQPLKGI